MPTDAVPPPVAYEDGDSLVVCDRKNPAARIRSDTFVDAGAVEREDLARIG